MVGVVLPEPTAAVRIDLDTTPPALEVSGTSRIEAGQTASIQVSTDSDAVVRVHTGIGEIGVDRSDLTRGEWTALVDSVDLAAPSVEFTVLATDQVGNTKMAVFRVAVVRPRRHRLRTFETASHRVRTRTLPAHQTSLGSATAHRVRMRSSL